MELPRRSRGQPGNPLEIGSIAVGPTGNSLFVGVPTGAGQAGTDKLNARTGSILASNLVSDDYPVVEVAVIGSRGRLVGQQPLLRAAGTGSAPGVAAHRT